MAAGFPAPTCPACSHPCPPGASFCPECGERLDRIDHAAPTLDWQGERPSDTGAGARFVPGTVLAGRYRIVSFVGRGGMGEVYRADDLRLGEPVALKFLPTGTEHDPAWRDRFLSEVRLARSVTHPNVCRVHDVGEVDGHPFLSMEYVHGEDLASLLRRIGRLPQEKAVELGREICLGLAAAHHEGVLHRDLKPANVLIDGRGRAKITDFGLAAPMTEAGEVGGTPAYMAPEQLDGKPATVQSDLFALGLVLYELFTGSRAFPAAAGAELRHLYESSSPTSPAALVAGIDPAAERAMLRCLETDPARRPGSAREVAAALPGGDPLQAALAAGETPSPELVAAAGSVEELALGRAWALLAALLAAFTLVTALAPRSQAPSMAALPYAPEVLAAKARDLLVELGHEAGSEHRAWGFLPESRSLAIEGEIDEQELAALDEIYRFWYRQADEPLLRRPRPANFRGVASPQPPEEERLRGEASVVLTASGRLRRLEAPPPEAGAGRQQAEAWWGPLLAAAGLDEASLRRLDQRPERATGEQRIAWHAPDGRQVDAVAVGGVPVSFAVAAPAEEVAGVPGSRRLNPLALIQVVALVGAAFLARRNLRHRRDDRLVARRLALATFIVGLLIQLLGSPQLLADSFSLFLSLSLAAGFGAIVGVLYLAIEPYGRRHWPVLFVSWVRLWRGRWRDPLVGRHLLYGVAAGTVLLLLWSLSTLLDDGRRLAVRSIEHLRSVPASLAELLAIVSNAVLWLFFYLVLLVLVRALLRRTRAANATFAVILLLIYTLPHLLAGAWWLALVAGAILLAFVIVLFRFGVLALWTAWAVFRILGMGLTPDPADWRLRSTLLIALFVVGTGIWGFWAAVGGRPFLPDEGEQAPARA